MPKLVTTGAICECSFGTTPASLIGDWLASLYDQNVANLGESCSANITYETISLLKELQVVILVMIVVQFTISIHQQQKLKVFVINVKVQNLLLVKMIILKQESMFHVLEGFQ